MKKRIILTILPALMVLAGCSGVNVQPKANVMLEDATACEEVFGEANFAGQLGIRKEANRDVNPLAVPQIGVQYKEDEGGTYAVRFVAAITSLNVTATWTRGITAFDNDGNPIKPNNSFATTKAYASLKDGDDISTASTEYPGYNYYVVYTMRKIPANYKRCYIFAYLTLEDELQNTVQSIAAVSRVENGNNNFSFNADSSGYFLTGTINGEEKNVSEDKKRDNESSFYTDFKAGDSFAVVKKEGQVFNVWDGPCLGNFTGFANNTSTSMIDVSVNGKYVIYLNNGGVYPAGPFGIKETDYYVRGTVSPDGWNPTTASSYRLATDPDNKGVLLNVHLSTGVFKIAALDWGVYALGADRVIGGAAGNFSTGPTDNNIQCDKAGYYDLYLTKNDFVSIELVSLDPVEQR